MFQRLFADSGLSLDRLRALVELGAAGSIVKASGGDPVKQSQYSRQIKELEDFFQVHLTERHGKGIRLTPQGKELARISRFFLLGLANFQRGCLTEEQSFRIGAGATFIDLFLVPALAAPGVRKPRARYTLETVDNDEIERRLHELTLDFGVVTVWTLSRPLQVKPLREWRLKLWVPRGLSRTPREALRAFESRTLPLAVPAQEFPLLAHPIFRGWEPRLTCSHYLEVRKALDSGAVAAFLPDFMRPSMGARDAFELAVPGLESVTGQYGLAWNPRLLRLNRHAARQRDLLIDRLAGTLTAV